MDIFFGVILGLAILVFLVVLHELGHAIAARRNGVIVEEFGIGFPPRAWSKKLKNKILFSLNWLPLGGFVKLQGEYDSAKGKGDYGAASYWQKTKILLAGVGSNWIIAALLLTVLAWTGLPKVLPDQFTVSSDTTIIRQPVEIVSLENDFPAKQAGLAVNDTIIRFAGEEVPTTDRLIELTKENAGEKVDVIYTRNGTEASATVQLKSDASAGGLFGAGLHQQERTQSTWSAPVVGVGTALQFSIVTVQELGKMLVSVVGNFFLQFSPNEQTRQEASASLGAASENVAGPVGILGVIFPAAGQAGLTQITLLTAIISLTLAIMNALPIPALDGGRWFTMSLFRLLKRPLTKEREEKIQGTGFMILLGLIVLVTIADVGKLFS